MTTCRAGTLNRLVLLVALVGGCTTAPTIDQPAVVVRWEWEVAFTDSCGKLAGVLGMVDLFDLRAAMPPGERDMHDEALAKMEAEMEKRCPDDVKPDMQDLHLAISIPTIACAELRGLLATADAFEMMATLPRDKREIADKLMDDFEAEIEKRCPALD